MHSIYTFDYLVSVNAESWYFFQMHKNFFRAAQIDLEPHILSKKPLVIV